MKLQHLKTMIREGDLAQLKSALAKVPDLLHTHDSEDWEERTLLHCAARYAKLDIVKFLVQQGAEVYSHPHHSYPAVFIANQYQYFPDRPNGKAIVDYFLDEIPDRAEGTLGTGATIHIAARLGFTEVVRKHLELDPLAVHQRGWLGDTPLHWSCHNGHIDIVRMLIDAGADIEADEINCYGGKPLHWASEHEVEVVKFLLSRGAQVDSINRLASSDFYSITPLLMNACQRDDCAEVTELLLNAGASLNVKFEGKTPLEVAASKGNSRIEAVLAAHQTSSSRQRPVRTRRIPLPPPRPVDGHKGTFGNAMIVAGSKGMSGAARLAGQAALHSGVGLVTVASPADILSEVASGHPSYMTVPLDESLLARLSQGKYRALGIGPGLGGSALTSDLVKKVYQESEIPLVLDADGLNAFESCVDLLSRKAGAPGRVLTPHPGEFARLTARNVITADAREEMAIDFARKHQVVLLLKGHETIITDGRRLAINDTGSTALATGGSGDVLTGLIAGLLAQGMEPFNAAYLSAHLHGRAGEIAGQRLTERFVSSQEILLALADAWQEAERLGR